MCGRQPSRRILLRSVSLRQLISLATRREFRDLASDSFVLREIDAMWEDEGVVPSDQENGESSQRRNRFRQYEDAIDWTDAARVSRALLVFEKMLRNVPDDGLDRWRRQLDRDGYDLTPQRRIVVRRGTFGVQASLKALRDASAILEQLDRIERALPEDPAQAIGSAKELIEATAKTVLLELNVPFDDGTAKLLELINAVQRALGLHPAVVAGPDGTEAVKRILGGLSSIAIGVAELRNRGYGTGHAMVTRAPGLHARHAHLAVGAASTWCHLVLDTYTDPLAPWRKTTAVPVEAAATSSTGDLPITDQ
jgi:Abortive infection C-terminus